jgi:Zinc finger C-x8-C-x5-C-x3-H type (and similar)
MSAVGGGSGGSGGGGNRRICFEWRDNGTCRFGVKCVYAHIGNGGSRGSNSSIGNSSSNNTNWRQQQHPGGRGSSGGGRGSRGGGRGSTGGGGRNQGNGGGRMVSGDSGQGGGGGSGSGRRGGTMGIGSSNHQQQHQPDDATRNVIERFVQHLSVLTNSKLGIELIDATKSELWLTCWKRHSLLLKSTRLLLVQVLARLPESANVPPPSMPDHIVPVLTKFIQEQTTTNSGNSAADPDVILTSITTVRDVVKRCVQFDWPNGSQSSIKNGLEAIILEAENRLLKQSKDHRQVASDLMQELEYLEKPWRIRIQESSIVPQQQALLDNTNSDDMNESPVWKDRPTIGWLKDASHFTPSSCPLMSRDGIYESSREYLETIHKIWTAMTFYDGHAACAPTCRARGSGAASSCGKVLWPVAARGGASEGARSGLDHLTCRRPNCSRPVDFCCSVAKSHDALCASCASRTVAQRLGAPGPAACTHIYDATIEAVHPDGILHLEQFKSRRPPEKPVHWRSTKSK